MGVFDKSLACRSNQTHSDYGSFFRTVEPGIFQTGNAMKNKQEED